MKITAMLARSSYELRKGTIENEISDLIYDSRKVKPGTAFIALVGMTLDGHDYIIDALSKGATAIITQAGHHLPEEAASVLKDLPENGPVTWVIMEDTRRALSELSAAFFGYPAERIPVIGITGTKGKTTTTYMVKSILEHAGKKVGLIGTIEVDTGKAHIPSGNTTPESYLVQKYLREMVDNGCDMAVMEVSSQALMLDRVHALVFEIGVFTNLEPDHIGPTEHKDFEEYMASKKLLFKQCRLGIFNIDDTHAEEMMEGSTCRIETISAKKEADLYAENIHHIFEPGVLGIAYDLKGKEEMHVELTIPGRFSVYNSLTAIAVAGHFLVPEDAVRKALRAASVKGRVEPVAVPGPYSLLIDYAHNAMALRALLGTLREYEPGRIVCVFGCGGNRSRSRRFEMGEVSGQLADFTIITSDNPRFEEPLEIIADIRTGVAKTGGAFVEIPDRKEAIAYAMHTAQPGDVIVLAGKGHEDYQEIRGEKHPMDERVLVAEIIKEDSLV